MRYCSKPALLADIGAEHDTLCTRLDGIPSRRYREPGVWGDGWTLADLVAHLAEWHLMFLTWYDDGVKGVSPRIPAPGYKYSETPELNRAIWAKHRSRSARDSRADFEKGYARILAIVESLSGDQLLRPGHFGWTKNNALVTYLGANTASHYRFASRIIKRWTKATGSAPARISGGDRA